MVQNVNYELKNKDVFLKTFLLIGKINDKKIINNLIDFIKINKKDLTNKTHVQGGFTGFESLTNNENFIDFLKNIKEQINVVYKENFIIRDAWGTYSRLNEEITEHNHAGVDGFCGILYLTKGGPGTYFRDYDLLIEEEVGKYVLFHPILKHRVEKITANIERFTVAFNMVKMMNWENYENVKWIK